MRHLIFSLFLLTQALIGLNSAELMALEKPDAILTPDPALPYQADRSNPVIYDVDFSVVVTPPYKAKKLRVWLPVPVSDSAQEVTNSKFSSFPISVEPQVASEPKFGNRFAYFEFDAPQGAQIIRHKFRIKVWELRWNVDPAKVLPVAEWPASFDKYRQGETQSVVVDARFTDLLNEIVPQRSNSAADLGRVMNWVQGHLEYDHHDASLKASSEHALEKRRGHCSDYHGLCASLGRAMGVPTRVTYGINPFPKNSPSHCKLEAYLHPYGWVSFDVSETQKLAAIIQKSTDIDGLQKAELIALAQTRLAQGFRDNTWFLQTRGTDYDLVPAASKRVPVVRTAYVEADGVALPDPDPADKSQSGLSWMTVHEYRPDQTVLYPFADPATLTPVKQ
ncbi:MAG: transglutaminase domain-containing protein [Planctomycetaceae bacterium]